MPEKKRTGAMAVAAARKPARHGADKSTTRAQPPSATGPTAPAASTTPDRRKRAAPPANEPAGTKKQKTARRRSALGASVGVPATPDATRGQEANHDAQPASKAGNRPQRTENTASTMLPTPKPKRKQKKNRNQDTNQTPQQTSALPLEPHAALLGALQKRHDALVLSVISSTKMEKRIAAILSHLGKPSSVDPAEGAVNVSTPPRPATVLLHARAADAGKLISIVEIAKRRIREGFFRESTRDNAGDAGDAGDARNAPGQWYQYNRLYDVQTTAAARARDGKAGAAQDDDLEDDAFEPLSDQFRQAIGATTPSTMVTTTYMSVFLSREPILELLKHPEITCQASTDPIEKEYQRRMTGKA